MLALALAAMADGTARRIAQAPITISVALPVRGDQPWTDLDVDTVTQALRRLEGVAQVRVLAAQEVGRLVQPWLGSDAALAGLPLPRLIDVTLEPNVHPDTAGLLDELARLAPGATVDPEAVQEPRLDEAARALRGLGLGIAAAIFLALAAAVAAMTRMSLDLHQATVDLLRLMGASEGYVGRQFEQHALANGLRGSLAGFAAAVLMLAARDRRAAAVAASRPAEN